MSYIFLSTAALLNDAFGSILAANAFRKVLAGPLGNGLLLLFFLNMMRVVLLMCLWLELILRNKLIT